MNGAFPPGEGVKAEGKTSALAVWSLVLGILSVACFSIFTGIPGVICGHKALTRIRRSGGILTGKGLAIGGLVTGYIGIAFSLVVIPMLMAIAIPNFVKARQMAQSNVCLRNLKHIQSAKEMWALENKKEPASVPEESGLLSYLKNQMPKCPAGGEYKMNAVSESPTCTVHPHKLN